VQHLPGGEAVDHGGLGLCRVQAVRHGYGVGRVDQHVTGPAADLGQRRHPVAGRRPGDPVAGRGDRADQVVSRHERERRLVVVAAAAHLLLGERDAGGLRTDQHLVRTGRRHRPVPDLQPVRLDGARQDDFHQLVGDHGDPLMSLSHLSIVRGYNAWTRPSTEAGMSRVTG
jgi:hypothetical protein